MRIALAIASLALVAGTGFFAAATVLGLFTDTQQATSNIVAGSASATDLYICDISSTTNPPSATCPGVGDGGRDDSGEDEIIFEGVENLLPAIAAQWDIRFRNVGDFAWDSNSPPSGGDITITEVNDPLADCTFGPVISFTILGKAGDAVNDNHTAAVSGFPDDWFREGIAGSDIRMHVEPGDYEDVRIRASLNSSAGNECRDNAWDVSINFLVQQDP